MEITKEFHKRKKTLEPEITKEFHKRTRTLEQCRKIESSFNIENI